MKRPGLFLKCVCAFGCVIVGIRDVSAAIPEAVDVVVAGGTEAGVRAALKAKSEGKSVFVAAPRPYLGEDRAGTYLVMKTAADDPSDPLVRAMFDPATRADAAWTMPEDRMGIGLRYKLAEALNRQQVQPDADGLLPMTTPLEVKRTFDRALLKAGIPFLTGVGVIGIERDESGRLTAVVVNGRDGNRRIRCTKLIDATIRGKIAERAGGVRKPFPADEYVFRRAFIHELENFKITWRTFKVRMADGSAESFQEADNVIRDSIAPKDYVDMAEFAILENPPDVFTALPADVQVVGPCAPKGEADVAKPQSSDLPIEQSDISYDVVVVGVGTSGAGAAVGASRRGAKTLAVDFMTLLGGVGSEGRICGYYDGNICGFTLESDNGREELGGIYYHAQSEWFRREIRKNKGTVWFACAGIDVIKEGNRVTGVVIRMDDGTVRRVKAKAVVDATGNSDVAAQAGAETDFINGRELSLQGAGFDVMLNKASILGAIDAYSHFRALSTYFEKAGDKRAVPVLAKLLKTPGICGHACPEGSVPEIPNYSNEATNAERSDCLRELCLARALYRLGDDADALGRRTLEAYARDPRGAFATHARIVLNEGASGLQ